MKRLLFLLLLPILVYGQTNKSDYFYTNNGAGGSYTTKISARAYTGTTDDTTGAIGTQDYGTFQFTLSTLDSATILIYYQLSQNGTSWSTRTLLDSLNSGTQATGFKTLDFTGYVLGAWFVRFEFVFSVLARPVGTTSATYTATYKQTRSLSYQVIPSAITIVGGSAVQDSITAKVNTKDTVGRGATYTTQTMRVTDSTAEAAYRDNLVALKVAIADSTAMPGYATKTQHNTKVAKADSATMPGYGSLSNVRSRVAIADSGTTLPGYATKTEHNTKVAKADSATYPGYVTLNVYVVGIDSFATTSAADTVAIAGVTSASIAFVELYYPDYSTTVDTAAISAVCLVSGAGTAQLAVTREKRSWNASPAALKSGQHYRYFIKR